MASTTTKTVMVNGMDYELPFLELLPRLSDEKFSELRDDIIENGIKARISAKKVVGEIADSIIVVDGNHRVLVASELGIPVPADFPAEYKSLSMSELEDRAMALNIKRRHLDAGELARLSSAYLAKGLTSRRARASKMGVPESTLRGIEDRSGARIRAPERSEEERYGLVRRAKELKKNGLTIGAIAQDMDVSKATAYSYVTADLVEPDGIDPLDGNQLALTPEIVPVPEPPAPAIDFAQRALDSLHGTAAPKKKIKAKTRRVDIPAAPLPPKPVTELKQPAAKKPKPVAEHKPMTDHVITSEIDDKKLTPSFHDLEVENQGFKNYPLLITSSFWPFDSREKGPGHDNSYHGNCIPQIPYQVMHRYTRKGDVFLDMFVGGGTTMVKAVELGRDFVGVDVNVSVVDAAREKANSLPPHKSHVSLISADSSDPAIVDQIESHLDANCLPSKVDHIFLHPPYWNIIKFSDNDERDLSHAPSLEYFLAEFRQVAKSSFHLLAPGRFCTLVIGDTSFKGDYIDLESECNAQMKYVGFKLVSRNTKEIRGNERGKGKDANLWRYRCLKHGIQTFDTEWINIFKKVLV